MQRPPGPKPRFLIGNFPLAGESPLSILLGWARQFGDIFYYRAGWLHVYFVNHPELIETVLVRNHHNLVKDRVMRKSRWFFGQGLLTSEGDFWLRQRRLLQPSFHRERIASYARIITDYTEQVLATWNDGEVRDIHQEMMQLTLRIVIRCLFNVEPKEVGKISGAMNTMMHNASGLRMLLPPLVRYLPVPPMIKFLGAVRLLDDTVYHIIEATRGKNSDSGDLLSSLMQARDKDGSGMTTKQLRDEVLTFMLAGHETTALALSWTWYLLAEHPEVADRLHHELRTVLNGRAPAYSDLSALPYTDCVLKEVMRLYPPAWSLARTVITSFELRGYTVPTGANIVMSQWIMHRDPRYFSDPERFDPNRWLTERSQKLPRFAYFPFGGGPRQCIGNSFAMMEATLILATVAQRFEFNRLPGHPVTPIPSFTLRPKHGMRMKFGSHRTGADRITQ